jgi:hypothetical protein
MDSRGVQYKNMLDPDTTLQLLGTFKPRLVFSGDDHDQCEYAHSGPAGRKTVEYTVGTFSWMQGNRVPSVGQLSISRDAYAFEVCPMPDQLGHYVSYAVLLAATLVWVVVTPCVYHCCRRRSVRPSSPVMFDVDRLSACQLTMRECADFGRVVPYLTMFWISLQIYYFFL